MTEEQLIKLYSGGWRSISDNQLLSLLKKNEIQFSKLMSCSTMNSKDTERLNGLKKAFAKEEESLWKAATDSCDPSDYQKYLDFFGENSIHAQEAKDAIEKKDKEMWENVMENPSREAIEDYRKTFPNGFFISKSNEVEEDLPWYVVKKRHTIETYLRYKKEYPGRHDAEADQLIEEIKDESAWKIASINKSKAAYIQYIEERAGLRKKFEDFDEVIDDYVTFLKSIDTPVKGCRHFQEALNIIGNVVYSDILLGELKKDPNKYNVDDLKKQVENIADMRMDDLRTVFTDDQIEAIKNYKQPKQLEFDVKDNDPNKVPRGFAEVYFWGLRGTGKTCAIGATIGFLSSKRQSIMPIQCPGEQYLLQLQNLFSNGGKICKLPPGTPLGYLPAMAFKFDDKNGYEHRVTFIDVAGEVFSSIYRKEHGKTLEEKEKKAIENLERHLKDKYNNKIHFFIIEYGDENGEVELGDGLTATKSQVMLALAQYFEKKKIFSDSSVSMNLLVTKCDRIRKGDRMEEVIRYVDESGWAPVANGINNISRDARTGCLYGMGFSIGEVFAKDLCVFCPDDAECIVEELEQRTHAFKHNWWSRLIDSFRVG